MATYVREGDGRNSSALWVVLGVVAVLAVLAFFFMASNGRNDTASIADAPSQVAANTGRAAESAADAAGDAASGAANSVDRATR